MRPALHGFDGRPEPAGLYDPANEHDSCGVAFLADLGGAPSHEIVRLALTALRNMEHRGASGAQSATGDGAGILIQVPDGLLRASVHFELPPRGAYAVGTAFLPTLGGDPANRDSDPATAAVNRIAAEEGLRVLGWRELPIDPTGLGSD
ncbi:MAG: hypothetical protein ACYCO3_12205, partial [Mycobacteriales bacterium]